jgi:hypothetical protein
MRWCVISRWPLPQVPPSWGSGARVTSDDRYVTGTAIRLAAAVRAAMSGRQRPVVEEELDTFKRNDDPAPRVDAGRAAGERALTHQRRSVGDCRVL